MDYTHSLLENTIEEPAMEGLLIEKWIYQRFPWSAKLETGFPLFEASVCEC
jgi:hypothetical protein